MYLMHILFSCTLMTGTFIAISAQSWMIMWMGLEINLLSFIPLMSNPNMKSSIEASLKYFITQAMASMIMLSAIMLALLTHEFISLTVNSILTGPLLIALMIKLGAAPFHYWFPQVMDGLSWYNTIILVTWQKIAPLMLMMNLLVNKMLMLTSIVLSLIISTISSFNLTSLKKIIAYSSINHLGWMLSSMLMSWTTTLIYYVVYAFTNIIIILFLSVSNMLYINQYNNINSNKMTKLLFMVNFLSLAGIPPMVGFFPKWIIINSLTTNFLLLSILMIMITLIMIFIYTRILLPFMLNASFFSKPNMTKLKFPLWMNIMNMMNIIALPFVLTLIQFFL
uniref:NADH-ubiquinone oxidoreductase chain 2 n=1 Tax=Leiochrinini sp. 2 ACP-2013 TaxID=1434620 RepID=A0A3G3FWW0_9CUCU|nr:NADH dehydrogenase subunit 2 [Leiochrinini sp. 2 ACP-2013]